MRLISKPIDVMIFAGFRLDSASVNADGSASTVKTQVLQQQLPISGTERARQEAHDSRVVAEVGVMQESANAML